jgi:hypothetical protein
MPPLKPLLFGRLSRVLFGMGTFAVIGFVGPGQLSLWGTVALGLLGISFLVGGLMGNPGCEITALPNLFLSKEHRVHCG